MWKRVTVKGNKNNKNQDKYSKNQRCESKVSEWIEDDGVNYEDQFNKNKEKEN